MKKNNKEVIHFDYETFSEVDLMKCGMFRYAEDTSTEVICLSYAIGFVLLGFLSGRLRDQTNIVGTNTMATFLAEKIFHRHKKRRQ